MEHGDFVVLVGTTFRLRLPSGETLELRLLEATAHPQPPRPASRRRGFSLVFRSALPGQLPQRIYRLEHEAFGPIDLFLVPIGPRDGGMCYEAVFN